MVTASTAPARSAVNRFGATSHQVTYAGPTLEIHVSTLLANGNPGPLFVLTAQAGGPAQKIIYDADGVPTIATDASKTGVAVGAFNAYNGASGNAQARADAMDAYLQGQGIYPA